MIDTYDIEQNLDYLYEHVINGYVSVERPVCVRFIQNVHWTVIELAAALPNVFSVYRRFVRRYIGYRIKNKYWEGR